MEINPIILIVFALLVILFFVLYFIKNRKDREELEDSIMEDYSKPRSDSTRSEMGTGDYPEL